MYTLNSMASNSVQFRKIGKFYGLWILSSPYQDLHFSKRRKAYKASIALKLWRDMLEWVNSKLVPNLAISLRGQTQSRRGKKI